MKPLGDDTGSTLVAVLFVTMVLVVIGATVLKIAEHTNEATTLDRLRVQAVQAAEAGVNAAIRRLEVNSACDQDVQPAVELTDGDRVLARYRTRVDEEPGTGCGGENRVIRSWGSAPVASERSLRQVEVAVQLIPHEGFRYTLFASGSTGVIAVKNTGNVVGDVYAEFLDQTNNNVNAHSVISPGSIDTKNNAVYTGMLWSGGNVTLRQNGQVGASILAAGASAPGDVSLENGVNVTRDIRARGGVFLPTTYNVGGAISPNNPLVLPPPELDNPAFTWDPGNYSPTPTTFASATQASAHLYALRDSLQGTFYVDDPTGVVTTDTAQASYKVTGPLTIVATGKVKLGQTFGHVGGPWPVVVVSLSDSDEAIELPKPTAFSPGLHVLLFTAQGGVDVKNLTTMVGSIYADRIDLKNRLTINRSPLLANVKVPGFDWTTTSVARFTVVPVLWQEVAPQA